MNKESLDKSETQTGSLQSMETGKSSLGVIQRNCPNSQGDEIIAFIVIISIMREREIARSKTQEKQMIKVLWLSTH